MINSLKDCAHAVTKHKLLAWAFDSQGKHEQGFKNVEQCAHCGQAMDGVEIPVKKTYNHAYTFAFDVRGQTCPTGENVPVKDIVDAMINKINGMKENELEEVFGLPFDTFEE